MARLVRRTAGFSEEGTEMVVEGEEVQGGEELEALRVPRNQCSRTRGTV